MTAGFLERMERIALGLVAGVAIVWAIAGSWQGGVAVAVGGVVGLVNFRLIRTLIGRILTAAPGEARGVSVALSLKFAALAVVLYVLLNVVGLAPIPFCAGLSAIFPAMMLALLGGTRDIEAPVAAPHAHEPSAS